MAEHPVLPAPIARDANIVRLEEPAGFAKSQNPPMGLLVRLLRKAVLLLPVSAGQKQKKEQDVPVIKGLAAIAGSMAVEP
ncbi:hypothetical protein [Pseudobacter ginsenosidimutans]|jgi:hypothetical protein|uniref:hypothetical protein n=1 Tax=Pseudobacter ginsenosidimutans TaxID=661488 RepID=UPI00102DA5EC|nr:hypothetical protein [Pseudobacter ginsenosidimutans]QEC41478.1 hypothetical protein FSB84_07135 [Pseudobacter ginsenosidimutans]